MVNLVFYVLLLRVVHSTHCSTLHMIQQIQHLVARLCDLRYKLARKNPFLLKVDSLFDVNYTYRLFAILYNFIWVMTRSANNTRNQISYDSDEVKFSTLSIFDSKFGLHNLHHIQQSGNSSHGYEYYSYGGDDDDDDDEEEVESTDDRLMSGKEVIQRIESLFKLHGVRIGEDHKYHSYDANSDNNKYVFVIEDDKFLISVTTCGPRSPLITIMGVKRSGTFDMFCNELIKPAPPKKPKPNVIYIIGYRNQQFSLTEVSIKKRQHNFSYDNYNEGFEPISEDVVKQLKDANQSGLVLFHGAVGTGKTTYMKYLVSQIASKKIIYIPPDMVEHLASPSFVTFLMSQARDSILLIEDAETVLLKRDVGENQSVSNILNISDGILGDIMQMQLVCTFNCPVDKIDPALLRPGRLIAEYRFEDLSIERSQALVNKLYKDDPQLSKFVVSRQMSLAEIFNLKKLPSRTNPVVV